MTIKSKAFVTLYRIGKITKDGLKHAVSDNVITKDEYREITGEDFAE